jgi:amino acid adenylation domain-containing protein/non-ribosomal peptide synthase protein (TIGR01720 family)
MNTMNDQKNIITKLRSEGIRVQLNGENLEIISLKGKILPETVALLKANKSGIIEYLKSLQDKVHDVEIEKVDLQESYPVSSSQFRFWVLSQVREASLAYNMPFFMELEGDYSHEIFEKSIQYVIERHEILRTVFKENDNRELRQWILNPDELNFKLNFQDFRNESNALEKARAFSQEDNAHPFDLEKGPLFRATLMQLENSKFAFYYNLHHIIGDAWSQGVLANDLMTCYKQFVNGLQPTIEPLTIQYKDYSAWQKKLIQDEKFAMAKSFWKEHLSGELPKLNLPECKTRPAVKTYNGGGVESFISTDLTKRLKDFCVDKGGSLFMGLSAVWNALCHRYTSENDFIFGTPASGRDHANLDNQIGAYINTLALRNRVDSNDQFETLFNRIKETTLAAFSHQAYPFDQLVDDLNLQRDPSRNPVFDVMITLQNTLDNATELVITDQESNEVTITDSGISKFDLDFTFQEIGSCISFSINYNKDIFDQDSVIQLMNHYKQLLASLLMNPTVILGQIDYLNAEEKKTCLGVLQDNEVGYPKHKTIHGLFTEQAQTTPDNIALVSGQTELTYRELDAISSRFAHYLIETYSVKTEDLLAIKLDRSEWMIITILAILKTGAAYVPIDPSYPEERIIFTEKDSNCKVCIDSKEIEKFKNSSESYASESPNVSVDSKNLAYVIYTSGTTGVPKGVLIDHENVVRLFKTEPSLFDFNSDDIWTLFHSYCFDFSVWEMYGALLFGGKLVIIQSDVVKSPKAYLKVLKEQKVTVLNQTPSAFYNLMEEALGAEHSELKIRYVIFGGEALLPGKLRRWKMRYPDTKLINMYGITETTVHVTYKEIGTEEIENESMSIGRPIPTLTCYLLDENGMLVPRGVKGEIYVGGKGVARGYLNKTELTNEKFIENPVVRGERVYKTGDLGKWNAKGEIDYLGRSDDQVKIRGHRIELGEVEQAVQDLDVVESAIALVSESNGDKEIVVYLTAKVPQIAEDLRSALKAKLPVYMLPSRFVQLDEIPLTINGKADKKALLKFEGEVLATGAEYAAPESIEENLLVNIWEKILKRKNISIKDDFFNLGGDSIKSIQIVSRIKQQGYVLKVEDVLRTPILEDLAKLVQTNTLVIDQSEIIGEVELTPIQHHFLNDDHLPVKEHFNQSILLKSVGKIETEILTKCYHHLMIHHDALRMTFSLEDGKWKQFNQAANSSEFVVQFFDLTNVEAPLLAMEELGREIQSGFDLESGPLFKMIQFRMTDGDRIGLIAHHLVIDGVSWRILLEDLKSLFEQYSANEHATLSLKTDAYKVWAKELKLFSKSEELTKEMAFWKELSNQSIPEFRVDTNTYGADRVNHVAFTLDADVTERLLTKSSKAYNTKINDVLLTALARAISEVIGIEKFVVRMEGHGREEILDKVDITRTVGWFTTIYPFVLDISSSKDEIENLVGIKEDIRKIPNNGIGYGMLKYLSGEILTELKPSIVFNYLGDFGNNDSGKVPSALQFSSESIGENSDELNKTGVLLDVSGVLLSDQLTMSIVFNERNYKTETIQHLADSFKSNLSNLINLLSKSKISHKTPSDLSFTGLSQTEIDTISANTEIVDIYKLSPLQGGLFFQWLKEPGSESYIQQISQTLHITHFDAAEMEHAYQTLLNRHGILRTSFTNQFADVTLQIVHKTVIPKFSVETAPESLTDAEFDQYLEQQRKMDIVKGFDLTEPSQMKIRIIDLGGDDYEFIWTHHHILMDGWCLGILIGEFYEILNSNYLGVPLQLPKSKEYVDYINWLGDYDVHEPLKYWKSYLEDYSEITRIPYTKKKDKVEQYNGKVQSIEIEPAMFARVDEFCKENGLTQNTFIQSIWGFLLSKYNNRQDVVFGSIVSGRPAELSGVENMVGLFINSVPVRVRYEADDTPVNLCKNVQRKFIESTPYQFVGLSEIQEQSELGMDLIQHYTVFENFPFQDVVSDKSDESEDLRIVVKGIKINEQNHYNFSILIAPNRDSMTIKFRYNAEKYEESGIAKIMEHLQNLIRQFLEHKNAPLCTLDYMSEEEIATLLNEVSIVKVPTTGEKSIVQLFEECVERNPEAIAVSHENNKLNYRELNEKANQLAHYLQEEHKIQPNDFVGIKLDKSEWMIVSILGILKLGAVFVPIDSLFPQDRINYILENSGCKVLIDNDELQQFKEKENLKISNLNYPFSKEDIAYMIYTSGSTGLPKGVLVHHGALLDYVHGVLSVTNLDQCKKFGLLTTIAADLGSTMIYPSLILGGELRIFSDEELRTPSLAAKIDVDCIKIVPSHWRSLQDNTSTFIPSKCLIFGGEKLTESIVSELKSRGFEGQLYNHYGPTETTIGKLLKRIDYSSDEIDISLGKPFGNNRAFILDKFGKMCPPGIVGEICLEGIGVTKGYLNSEDPTNQKFIDSPFSEDAKMYRTGDLGVRLPNGDIDFIGRSDDQVKVRGYRVELKEIEHALLQCKEVEQVIVLAQYSEGRDLQLVAYVVAKTKLNSNNLRMELGTFLPEYMVPDTFIEIDKIPLTINGKIDKNALPDPEENKMSTGVEFIAARNVLEERLVEIWKEILGAEVIGVNDNFFDLGGQSIKAIKVVMKVQKEFKVSLNLQELFQNPTIDFIANRINEMSSSLEIDASKIKKTIEL